MKIELCVPSIASLDFSTLMSAVTEGQSAQPFHAEAIALLNELSDFLLHQPKAQRFPELVSLGFALRKTEIERLRAAFAQLSTAGRLLQPRGIVFQIAAGNVDSLFIHTWIFALLTGNRSIIRLPSQSTPQSTLLCSTLNRFLRDKPVLRTANHFIRYGHDKEITSALSAICDVRAIWGGDATVNAIRSIPLGPFAQELTFADRYSLAALSSQAYLDATPETKQKLAHDFWNDSFWFDQLACSSPRLVVWCGAPEQNKESAGLFFEALESETVRRGTAPEPSTKMAKFLYVCETAIDQPVTACLERPQFTVLDLESLQDLRRDHCGGGLFLQYQTQNLADIVPYLKRKDQTLAYFGFDRLDLEAFTSALNGRAVDRIVPIGQALTFGRFWDGYDLLAEFTRAVSVA